MKIYKLSVATEYTSTIYDYGLLFKKEDWENLPKILKERSKVEEMSESEVKNAEGRNWFCQNPPKAKVEEVKKVEEKPKSNKK